MKQTIIKALNVKFDGVSESILGRVADKLISSGKVKKEEDVETVVAGLTFQSILDYYGDDRADQAQKSAVRNYENKHKIKDGKPVQQPDGGVKPEDKGTGSVDLNKNEEIPAWAQSIMEQNRQLAARFDAMQQEKTVSSRQTRLGEILKNAPSSIRSRYEKDFARMTFKDDEEFDGWINELAPDVEQISADINAKGGIVNRPKGGIPGGGKSQVNPILNERIEQRVKAESQTPAIMGLTVNNQ